ncbi:hypothetical protein D3C80_1008210 [compost metagenome]
MPVQLLEQAQGDGLRHLHVEFGLGVVDAFEQSAIAIHVQPVLEVQIDLAGVGQANPCAGLRGVDHAHVGAIAPGAVLVFVLAVGAVGETEGGAVDGCLRLQHAVHGLDAEADRPLLVEAISHARYQRQAEQAGVLREVTTGPVVVVVDRQPEVAVLAETDAPVFVQFMADEKTAAGNRVEGVATAAARGVGAGIAVEAQIAVQHLQTGGDLCAGQVAHARRVAGDGRGALGAGSGTGVGQAGVIGADFVKHDAAGPGWLAAQGE